MDEIRRFRLIVTPFAYVSWLALGLWISDWKQKQDFVCRIEKLSGEHWAALVAVAVAATLPVGYLINTFTLLIVRVCSRSTGTHEEALPSLFTSNAHLHPLWAQVGVNLTDVETIPDYRVFATATLAYGPVEEGIGLWITRRWATFNIGCNSAVAMMLAFFTGTGLMWQAPIAWLALTLILVPFLVWRSLAALKETRGMLEFQARRVLP